MKQYNILMQKKRDLKKLYKPPSDQDYSQNYKRLVIVILISVVFIAGEIIAGIFSHSIAIISDAIHLISDTVGFFTSFLFLYLSKWRPTEKMSFGYHRMELLGAIANIFIIWILIFFVVYQSTNRIIDKEFVEEPMAMLITAGGGLIVNIVMYKVLHNGQNHSHGLLSDGCSGHDHGHHGHQHNHNESGSNSGLKNQKQSKPLTQTNNLNLSETDCMQDICKDDDCNTSIKAIHCHKNSDIHRHKPRRSPRKLPPLEYQKQQKYEKINVKSNDLHFNEIQRERYCEQEHQHSNLCYLNTDNKPQHSHVCQGHNHVAQNHQHHNDNHKRQIEAIRMQDTIDYGKKHQAQSKKQHNHQHNGQCSHDHGRQLEKVQKNDHNHTGCGGHHDHNHQHHDHNHQHHEHSHEHKVQDNGRNASIGMQAAVLHALSDMIMSVGLIISALVIFFLGNPGKGYTEKVTEWNPWHLFDPISTYLFSIIALCSTIPVVRNSYLLLMQSTPSYINLVQLRTQCQEIEGVIDVHDIHVWDLKPGKTCLIAHVLAKKNTERKVLVELSDIARKNKIFHTTFQVQEQEWKDEDSYILCDHDIH